MSPTRTPALPRQVDAVILGGGAGGLSLAAHLVAGGWADRRVLVVDDGLHPDRSWAYWSRGDGLLDPAASPGSTRLRVDGPGGEQVVALDEFRYRTLTGAQLRGASDRLATGAPGFTRVRGTVVRIDEHPTAPGVLISRPGPGDPQLASVSARWVFDSTGVAPGPALPAPRAGLRFLGHHVVTDHDAFDPTTPTLMDFRTDQSRGVAFVYVLPTSARTALVEYTRFASWPADRTASRDRELGEHVDTYLRRQLGIDAFRVVGSEAGAIPLVAAAPPGPRGAVVRIGTPAGMVKASTGYGFGRIQRHSAAIARSLTRHGHPHDVPGPGRWHRSLDALLLEVVRDDPTTMPAVFTRLFAANPGDAVLAFLDETASMRQELGLYRSLPIAPFRRAVTRRVTRRPRA